MHPSLYRSTWRSLDCRSQWWRKCTPLQPAKHDDLVTKVWYFRGNFMAVCWECILSNVARRGSGAMQYRFGAYALDTRRCELRRTGRRIGRSRHYSDERGHAPVRAGGGASGSVRRAQQCRAAVLTASLQERLSRFMVYCAFEERRRPLWPVYGSLTRSNVLLSNASLTILFLSETYGGRVHDKRITEATPYPLPAGSRLLRI